MPNLHNEGGNRTQKWVALGLVQSVDEALASIEEARRAMQRMRTNRKADVDHSTGYLSKSVQFVEERRYAF